MPSKTRWCVALWNLGFTTKHNDESVENLECEIDDMESLYWASNDLKPPTRNVNANR